MNYTPTVWLEGITDVGPTNLNHLETGVQAAAATADAAIPAPIGPATSAGLVFNGSSWVAAKLVNANIDAAAAIAYSKLTLAGSVVNNDVSTSAAIAISKLADPGAGNVVTSSGGGAIAAKPPGYKYAQNLFTADVSITATSAATAQAVVAGTAVSYDGTEIVVEFFSPHVINVAGSLLNIELYDGASDVATFGAFGAAAAIDGPLYLAVRFSPSNGSHTYSIKAWTSGAGSATVKAGLGNGAGVLVSGFVRVAKV